jgi:transcriptional/translational regulatory protein YebC/TACO1
MEIKKDYNIGIMKIHARINDGLVVLHTNFPQVTKKIYETAKLSGRDVEWNERLRICVERYPNLKAEEILKLIEQEIEKVKADASKIKNDKL